MAILDAELEFSDAQAVTAAAASTNVVDLTAVNANVGKGNQLYLQVKCGVTATSGGSATLRIQLQDCDTVGGTYAIVAESVSWAVADITAGTVLFTIALPPTLRQFVRVYYAVATANLTAGNFDAFIATVPNNN